MDSNKKPRKKSVLKWDLGTSVACEILGLAAALTSEEL